MALNELIDYTTSFVEKWQSVHGYAPEKTARAFDEILLKSILDMTYTLKIWLDKDELSDGEKILAAINIGALAEAWLRVFIIIWLRDYDKLKYKNEKGLKKEYTDLKFYEVIKYYRQNNILVNIDAKIFDWLDNIRLSRNTVHLCSKNKVYEGFDINEDFKFLCSLIDAISDQTP